MPAASYTLATLRSAVLTELQDQAGRYYTPAIVDRFINEELALMVDDLKCRRYAWMVDLIGGQAVYSLDDLSPRCLEVRRVAAPQSAASNTERELIYRSMEWMDEHHPGWRTDAANWPCEYTRWDQGVNGIRLIPTPASSQQAQLNGGVFPDGLYGGIDDIDGLGNAEASAVLGDVDDVEFLVGGMLIQGIASATPLTTNTDSVESVGGLPCQYQDALRLRVLKRCVLFDSDIQQAQKAPVYEGEAQTLLERAQTLIRSVFQTSPGARKKSRNF